MPKSKPYLNKSQNNIAYNDDDSYEADDEDDEEQRYKNPNKKRSKQIKKQSPSQQSLMRSIKKLIKNGQTIINSPLPTKIKMSKNNIGDKSQPLIMLKRRSSSQISSSNRIKNKKKTIKQKNALRKHLHVLIPSKFRSKVEVLEDSQWFLPFDWIDEEHLETFLIENEDDTQSLIGDSICYPFEDEYNSKMNKSLKSKSKIKESLEKVQSKDIKDKNTNEQIITLELIRKEIHQIFRNDIFDANKMFEEEK